MPFDMAVNHLLITETTLFGILLAILSTYALNNVKPRKQKPVVACRFLLAHTLYIL